MMDRGITGGFFRIAAQRPKNPAIYYDGGSLSYGEAASMADHVSRFLVGYGYGKGARIMMLMDNAAPFLQVFMGIVKTGMVAVPLPPQTAEKELTDICEEIQPNLIITSSPHTGKLYSKGCQLAEASRLVECHEEFAIANNEEETDSALKEDLFYISCSSGTTGRPKGIKRTHDSWVTSFHAMSQMFSIGNGDVILLPGPLYYSATLIAALHMLNVGGSVCIHDSFHPERVLRQLTEGKVKYSFMVPTMLEAVMRTAGEANIPVEHTFITAGAKMTGEMKGRFYHTFPQAKLFEYYGSAEAGFVTCLQPEEQVRKSDSVGKLFPGVDLKIIPDDRTDKDREYANLSGIIGEIWVKSKMAACGYVSREMMWPEQNDYIATGDIGYLDDEGFLYLTGRKNDRIISGGINIYPAEIERAIALHPEVEETVVFGVQHEYWGEMAVAAIKVSSDHGWIQENERVREEMWKRKLHDFLAGKLSPYKKPREILIVEHFPVTHNGKINRKQLAEIYVQKRRGTGGAEGW